MNNTEINKVTELLKTLVMLLNNRNQHQAAKDVSEYINELQGFSPVA